MGRALCQLASLFKHALRRLSRSPEFTLLSILMLALGVAMSTSAFSTANGALLRSLPFHEPERLVRVTTLSAKQFVPSLAPGFAIEICEKLADVGEFGLFMQQEQNIGEPGQPLKQQSGMAVTANALNLLGVQPRLGRGFLPGEDKPGKAPVMLLTDALWRENYASDASVLGKMIRVEKTNFTVVGVLPPEFDEPLLWYGCKYVTLMTVWPNWRSGLTDKWMSVMGRLRPSVSIATAQVRIDAFVHQMARDHPVEMGTDALRVMPLGSSFAAPEIKTVYWLVVGLSVLVLMIACANLGAVQIARFLGRQGELAVRTALGATRTHLVAALAAESFVIALAGSALGVLFTYWSKSMIAQWLHGPELPLEWRVISFAVLAGMLAMICFGLLPAWFITANSAQIIKETSRGATVGRSQHRWKFALVAGQLALALILVSTAASSVLGASAFINRDRGWQPEGLVSGAFQITWDRVLKERESRQLAQNIEAKLGSLPGVQKVAVCSDIILFGNQDPHPLLLEGVNSVVPGREAQVNVTGVSAAFFSTVGLKLREGRLYPLQWRRTDPSVAVVSASVARKFWPADSPLGQRIRFGPEDTWHEVVGVVSDATFAVNYGQTAALQVYRPIQDTEGLWFNFVMSARVPASALERSVRATFSQIDPDITVVQFGDLAQLLADFASVGPINVVLIAFALSGMLIATVGLYGVMSQLGHQRRRDIGVRIALGAKHGQIVSMMLAQGARLLAFGGVAGLMGAYVVARLFRHALPEFPMVGVLGTAVIVSVLGAAGLCACYIPCLRAARVNPVEVLRAE
jgi:putative ABC transport system permease protein